MIFSITKKKLLRYVLLPNVCLFTALVFYFPGSELPIALTLASGIHRSSLQAKIDHCEAKAINGKTFTDEEIRFLRDLYTCLYKGARLTIVLPEVSKLMEHYLSMSGDPFELNPSIFNTNDKVLAQIELIRNQILSDDVLKESYRSKVFYMPDFSNIDSVFGLYYGHITATPIREEDILTIRWRAEVPWEWPSYASLQEKYGNPHAESFPIPNASCILLGISGAVRIDNGLGEHIRKLGLAKPFIAYAEWTDNLPYHQ